ncbi:MAG TPA: hypothetical protein VHT53_07225, partial [Candidatus Elarobacter sp.]|nr:hypothetical protein [Candidatus Elarobacter sp.]
RRRCRRQPVTSAAAANEGIVLSEPLRWRALTWFPYWGAVLFATVGYSMGVGLATQASLPIHVVDGLCMPSPVHSLVATWNDVAWFPLTAASAIAPGAFYSGLEVAVAIALLALAPAALPSLFAAQRIFSAPIVIGVALVLVAAGWFYQIHHLQTSSYAACHLLRF